MKEEKEKKKKEKEHPSSIPRNDHAVPEPVAQTRLQTQKNKREDIK